MPHSLSTPLGLETTNVYSPVLYTGLHVQSLVVVNNSEISTHSELSVQSVSLTDCVKANFGSSSRGM